MVAAIQQSGHLAIELNKHCDEAVTTGQVAKVDDKVAQFDEKIGKLGKKTRNLTRKSSNCTVAPPNLHRP